MRLHALVLAGVGGPDRQQRAGVGKTRHNPAAGGWMCGVQEKGEGSWAGDTAGSCGCESSSLCGGSLQDQFKQHGRCRLVKIFVTLVLEFDFCKHGACVWRGRGGGGCMMTLLSTAGAAW